MGEARIPDALQGRQSSGAPDHAPYIPNTENPVFGVRIVTPGAEPPSLLQFPHPAVTSRPSWKWFVLGTVLLGATMSALDVSIVNVAMPTLTGTFGVSMATVEWVAMAYMLTLTVFLPLFGRLADVYGRSKLYNLGFVVFSLGSVLCGAATGAGFLIAARVVQAVGAGLLQANSVALITHAFPASERGKAIGIQGAVQAISMAVGPFVGGLLIAAVGWRAIFFVNLPIGALGTLAALLVLPPDRKPERRERVDYLGAALFASGLGLLVIAFNEGVKLGWGSSRILAYLVTAAVLLCAMVVVELRTEHPLVDLRLFRNRTFLIGNVTGMLSYFVLFAVMFLMPFYLEKVLGFTSQLTGSLLTPVPLAMAIVAPFAGHASDRFGSRVMTTAGVLVSAIACGSLLYLNEAAHLPLLVSGLVLLGVGMGLFTPPNNSAIMGAAPPDKLGVAGGVLNMMRSLGLIFGVDVSGAIFTTLERRYLAEKGFPDVRHVFSNPRIPLALKDGAFLHGFLAVLVVLLLVSVLSAVFSALNRGAALDPVAAETARRYIDAA
ncbi:MAG TPA: DHA2 family efflux MFS transporter permease subunit [Anaeromyxobacteraceae bacterium]|nr:DHA2 family efflux MFS transporter permease subunit [Anaeromyxobacteraceae bacterium]